MRRRCYIVLVAVSVLCGVAGIGSALAADEKQEINGFYKALLSTMKKPDARAAQVAELVEKNRRVAEKCLSKLKETASIPGHEAPAYKLLSSTLEDMLLLTGKRLECSGPDAERLRETAEKQTGADDKVFYFSHLAQLCPKEPTVYIQLGDLYFQQRQFGVARDSYKKALQIKDDPDTRTLLAKADEYTAKYGAGKPITVADVRRLFAEPTMSPEPGLVNRAVPVVNAIQTQVRFDEWSSAIKDEFKQQLKVVGQVARDEFQHNAATGLLIEGHTDRRGDPEKNERLSAERAESIKKWLVENFNLDPSRLRTAGYGFRKPYASADDPAAWAMNRRVEFKNVSEAGLQR